MANYFQIVPTLDLISRLELEFEESLLRKTASIFKEGIGQESNGAANQEKQIFLLCQISPSASSTRDLGTRLGASQTIAFLGFSVTRGDSGRIHYYRHIFKLKNHI